MIDIGTRERIKIDYDDVSNEKELILNVRITVDLGKKIVFNPTANIAIVRLKRMTL